MVDHDLPSSFRLPGLCMTAISGSGHWHHRRERGRWECWSCVLLFCCFHLSLVLCLRFRVIYGYYGKGIMNRWFCAPGLHINKAGSNRHWRMCRRLRQFRMAWRRFEYCSNTACRTISLYFLWGWISHDSTCGITEFIYYVASVFFNFRFWHCVIFLGGFYNGIILFVWHCLVHTLDTCA